MMELTVLMSAGDEFEDKMVDDKLVLGGWGWPTLWGLYHKYVITLGPVMDPKVSRVTVLVDSYKKLPCCAALCMYNIQECKPGYI